MRNIKLVIAFDGSAYAGWQRQKDQLTVQGVLEQKISVMTGEQAVVHGAGRTDAGVHALAMIASFMTDSAIHCDGFLKGLNSLLPRDIRILQVNDAPANFHPRFSATGKTYIYHISCSQVHLPTSRLYTAHFPFQLDIEIMKQCLDIVTGEHDFTSFEASGSRKSDPGCGRGAVRRILATSLTTDGSTDTITISLTGDGFLKYMVRNIVGTIIEAGKGKMSVEQFGEILKAKNRTLAGPTAPAHGLFLKHVFY